MSHSTTAPDYPVKGWNAAFDAISLKRLNVRTVQATLKKSGKTVVIARRALSQDGKMLTITATGIDIKGQKFKDVAVYDRAVPGVVQRLQQ